LRARLAKPYFVRLHDPEPCQRSTEYPHLVGRAAL
jgi:hypothetical protein